MSVSRRKFVKTSAVLFPVLSLNPKNIFATPKLFKRVRPGDALWPDETKWKELNKAVNGNLIKVESPLAACKTAPGSKACEDIFKELKNPYYIGDNVALTQSSGWFNAWSSEPSVYAVAAHSSADVAAAVKFAKDNNLRIVIKGGGHSYQGTSNCKDSLMVWTRAMHKIELHDEFVAQGCESKQQPQPAVTAGAGAYWLQMYTEVTTKGRRYVQGGGCTTVGVAGLIQSGGFGSFSKHYGTASAALLEAEIVTADGDIKIANECTNPDLFWALKGGGGGSFGVVTKLTLRTRELPQFFGAVFGKIKATNEEAYKKLIDKFLGFYQTKLFNHHWNEQVRFSGNNSMTFSMLAYDQTQEEMQASWQPFIDSIKDDPSFTIESPFNIIPIPAQDMWNVDILKARAPGLVDFDDRKGAPEENMFWPGNKDEVGQFIHAYYSIWLPESLLSNANREKFVTAIFNASRYWTFSFHFNKGLAGAPSEAIDAAKNTAINPDVLTAFALAIIAGEEEPAFKNIEGHEPDLKNARHEAEQISLAKEELMKLTTNAGSYVSESDYFEKHWQQSFWGSNYARLLEVKNKYDPDGLFFVHHGVGTEHWSEDGFTRLA